ncbi:hypothetical protein MF672_010835 [Actinomadura sp. ATCC 31491]|uniref:PepSY domain-containing protein n=1 Tax=Actinomadura luzonensis TaxID=2805427 RepID=A0ABT0FPN7_9ACTN|nr:hypothetical protein [Actinomadura luzonensis]MCK2214282.1 hypothetical protein [Actinomadura luzonensis]
MMTPEQAAARLGIAAHQVASVAPLDEDGHYHVTLAGERGEWLVSDQVARPYVVDVDGERVGEVDARPAGEAGDLEDEERTTEPAPKPTRRRAKQ